MIIRTLIPRKENTYSSFPSIVEHRDKLYVYYRQGQRDPVQCHGLYGKVRCFVIEKEIFLRQFSESPDESLLPLGKDYVVFESINEIDSIATRLDDNLFTLSTRTYVRDKIGRTYISYSKTPVFHNRHEVELKEALWVVFYGKPFKWARGFVFTAYGVLRGESRQSSLVLYTEDFHSWSLLSRVQGTEEPGGEIVFNECTIAGDGVKYTMYLRQDSYPYGIWYAKSEDLNNWSPPVKLLSCAHAPCVAVRGCNVYLTFRNLIDEYTSAIAIIQPFIERSPIEIERYSGDPFDGGYSDTAFIEDKLYVVYYRGNTYGEPDIRVACLDGDYDITGGWGGSCFSACSTY
ncbi:MAG: exo-alpha-sialidase [Nitrospirae bacterium]|nr:exo-alpha-sialidase [Nitrospirota bacterium]